MQQSPPTELSANSPSFFFYLESSTHCLMNQRPGSSIQRLRQCSPIKTRHTSLSTLFLRVFQMQRRNSGTEPHMLSCFGPAHACKHTSTYREREKKKKTKREKDCVRTRSENSQPTLEATNFCRSAIAARRQLLLM